NEILLQRGGSGAMFWILVGYDGQHGLYPDYDHYSVYNGGPTAALLERYARRFAEEATACEHAPPSVAPPSKFVRVRPLPKRGARRSPGLRPGPGSARRAPARRARWEVLPRDCRHRRCPAVCFAVGGAVRRRRARRRSETRIGFPVGRAIDTAGLLWHTRRP